MRILHICETATGGVASYINLLCDVHADLDNIVLAPSAHAGELSKPCEILTFPSEKRGLKALRSFLAAARTALREKEPDIVFCHSTFSLLVLVMMRFLGSKYRTIYCAHGWAVERYDSGWKRTVVAQIEGRLCALADCVINISAYDGALATRLNYRGHHIVIENAVHDRPARQGLHKILADDETLNLLFVGRFDRQKGLDLLLPAFDAAFAKRPDLRLHLIGAAVRADGSELDPSDGISIVGWVSPNDIDDWYASVDALIVPSRWEGFGLVVPEALRNGTPVICSDRGALPHLIDPGKTGEIFPFEHSALVQRLTSLEKSDLRNRREACRAAYENRFSAKRFGGEIYATYEKLIRSTNM